MAGYFLKIISISRDIASVQPDRLEKIRLKSLIPNLVIHISGARGEIWELRG